MDIPVVLRYCPMALPVTLSTTEIYYPDTDGLPVVESDFQLGPLIYALDALRADFQWWVTRIISPYLRRPRQRGRWCCVVICLG